MSYGTHGVDYHNAEEALQQSIILAKWVFKQLQTGNLRLTVAEAASMDALLRELVLQAAAIGGRIHQH
jgi:hypothetical protein